MAQRVRFSYVLNIALTLVKQGEISMKEIEWLRREFANWFKGLITFKALF
ncbi:hypothetical protein HBN50_08685 [Halobacteriovorax sp. GB3]|nr:hypothetical protein [Halobacteriovorax sp. GB3]MDD0853171.1 hypothetical protein [Halobacteriovorax sp. GB3]